MLNMKQISSEYDSVATGLLRASDMDFCSLQLAKLSRNC